ncbi:hypothetical protein I3842_16G079000 [Carya illinoinensis]|uniref:Retrovirus-related Pol polyprotein from transposon TNT 1-94-like beta-barrel domain-containing protein n=1 Tax=Carya illinoinensis TaxID=32201 RepID=A0A922D4R7_CARIL|nr:hypothetical protein I3842_16G079000 [Carya illinoinensis]
MCLCRDWFTTYESININSVLMGNDMTCEIIRIGAINIKMYNGIVRTLSNLRHIPSLKKTLISLGTLNSFNYQYTAEGEVIRVYMGSLFIMQGNKIDGMYFL